MEEEAQVFVNEWEAVSIYCKGRGGMKWKVGYPTEQT